MFTIDAFGPSGNGNDFHLIHDVSILAEHNSRQDFSPGMGTGLADNHLGELVHHQLTNLVSCVLRQRKVRHRNCRSLKKIKGFTNIHQNHDFQQIHHQIEKKIRQILKIRQTQAQLDSFIYGFY